MFNRILKYLLLFVCEFILVWAIVILEMLIKGYWGDTPFYFLFVFIVFYALTCYAWANIALGGDKKKKRQLGLISGAFIGFIAAMLDISIGKPILVFLHLPMTFVMGYCMAYMTYPAYLITFIIAIILQVWFWEYQCREGVISFRKKKKNISEV